MINNSQQLGNFNSKEKGMTTQGKLIIGVILSIAMLIGLNIAVGRVPPGQVGIKVNNLGSNEGVDHQELGVGYHYIGFFSNLFLFPTYKQNYVWTESPHEGNKVDESITFQTSEGLSVNADFGISFSIDPSKTSTLFQTYRKGIEEITHIYVRNNVRDAINEVGASMKVESLYGSGKTDLLAKVKSMVSEKLSPVGLLIDDIYVVGSLRFPENFVAALNAKLEAQQRAAQRENEVKEAEAQARKDVAKAQGEATANLTRAKAEAEANKLKLQTLTPQLIQYEAIQKWDGALPQITGGGSLPMINLKTKATE